MDAGRKQDATHIAQAAASFIKQHVPALYKTVFGYMVIIGHCKYINLGTIPCWIIWHECQRAYAIINCPSCVVVVIIGIVVVIIMDAPPGHMFDPSTYT